MRILVTGGAGFIGSHLCTKLVNEGHQVTCIDNFTTSARNNIEHLIGKQNFVVFAADISKDFKAHMFGNIEQIYNLASPTAPGHFRADPIGTLEANILGTLNVIKLGIELGIPILHTSTIRVFETDHTSNNACYTEGKRCAETLLLEYQRKYKNTLRIARLSNTYGPGMSLNDSRVMPQFIQKALRNEPLNIFGNGTQLDSFCYISDIIDALIKYMNLPVAPDILNIGALEDIRIKDLAHQVIRTLNSKSEVEYNNVNFVHAKPTEIDKYQASSILNWLPKITLREGIKKTAEYFKYIMK